MSDTAISSYTSTMLPSSNYTYSQQQDQLQRLQEHSSSHRSHSENHSSEADQDSKDTNGQQATSKKKKKATRACFHCQKAHLTCDDSRPCQRCIKRDLANTCTDGIRKRAKYLQDTEDTMPMSDMSSPQSTTPSGNTVGINTPPIEQGFINDSGLLDEAQIFGLPLANYGFGSETANLEYSILSNMLQAPSDVLKPSSTNNFANTQSLMSRPLPDEDSAASTPVQQSSSMASLWPTTTMPNGSPGQETSGSPISTSSANSFMNNPGLLMQSATSSPEMQQTQSIKPFAKPLPRVKRESGSERLGGRRKGNVGNTPEAVYANVKRPFSYAEGYHYLISFVKERMSREDLMRISRALALFRPSVLASMMNLTEDDLIFTEKSLQRTLLEYEKLISYSGTPTVVWRRTGEIALVGKEFSLLTQWSRDMLLDKKTYIYELMSNESAVEYWEKYATHAFDNTDSAVFSSCILMTPSGRPIAASMCFTIKRDIFDLPSVIVGNFLPILS
ncbi:Transcriptional regulator of nonfermentable carbon utilization [Umbelopsis sp. WA50703]